MLRITFRLSAMAFTMPRRSPLTRVTAGAFDGHVGAGAHRDSHIRRGQRGCVVDAVARHRHDAPCFFNSQNARVFVLGFDAGLHFINAETSGDGARGALVVAGHHDDAQSELRAVASRRRAWLL